MPRDDGTRDASQFHYAGRKHASSSKHSQAQGLAARRQDVELRQRDGVIARIVPRHSRRQRLYREHLAELARAIADGAKVRAFHAWSLLDNFAWSDGYSQRYGLTYVDFRNQKRTVKDSGIWYGRVAAADRLDLQEGQCA